jgi:hypothetical protein
MSFLLTRCVVEIAYSTIFTSTAQKGPISILVLKIAIFKLFVSHNTPKFTKILK